MHRFFVPASVRDGTGITMTGAQAHQIARVLRLRAGEEIALTPVDSGDAREWRVRLDTVDARRITGRVIAERAGLPESGCAVTLCPALLKGERFDWLVQKATELGVAVIQPVTTRHTVRKGAREDGTALARWRRIVTEAAEQSGRSRVPPVQAPVALGEIAPTGYDVVLTAHEAAAAHTIAAALPPQARAVAILIGPEGGFAADEVAWLVETRAAIPVSLGPRVLRAETAAIVAVTLALAATGGMEPPEPRRWVPTGDG